MHKDSILTGFVLGAIIPVLGYIVIDYIFLLTTQLGLIEEVSMSSAGKRFRTILLLAICTNLIPFQIAKSRRWDDTLRGIVFPTLVYVGFWVYKFYAVLF
jgi:hypothetical protein